MADVRDNPEQDRFEVFVDGQLAGFARYVRRAGRLFFVHTEVDAEFEGQGVGSDLAGGALEAARAAGTRVVPLCPFIASYIERHPEHAELVDRDVMAIIDNDAAPHRRVDELAEDLAFEGGFD